MTAGRAGGPVAQPRRRLRTRLLVAMLAIAFGVLVVAGVGAAAIARSTASKAAIKNLKHQAPAGRGRARPAGPPVPPRRRDEPQRGGWRRAG